MLNMYTLERVTDVVLLGGIDNGLCMVRFNAVYLLLQPLFFQRFNH